MAPDGDRYDVALRVVVCSAPRTLLPLRPADRQMVREQRRFEWICARELKGELD